MAIGELFLLRDLPRAVHGQMVFSEAATMVEDAPVFTVAIDSRRCGKGALFVALPGEYTDGHRFVKDAVRAGAVAALVQNDRDPEGAEWTVPVIQVPDTLLALQQLAAWYVQAALGSVTRIGVTGSNGKTTTKEMIASILRRVAPTSVSEGNLNSETGVPLAVFGTDPASRYAVYEMAMSNPGEMEPLAEIVRPDYAIITNIGTAHIGLLGDREAIAREKKAITSRFDGRQHLLVPEADDFVEFLGANVNGTVTHFGPTAQNASVDAETAPGSVTIALMEPVSESFSVPLGGYHNGLNALAAICLAKMIGVPTDAIREGLSSVVIPGGRSEIVLGADDRVILNDSYNSNPDSLSAALAAVVALHSSRSARPLVLILGVMKELGTIAPEAHREALRRARAVNPALLCLVGDEEWNDAIPAEGTAGDDVYGVTLRRFPSTVELAAELPELLTGGETVLLKGSRAVGLERLLPVLGAPFSVKEDGHDA